MNNPTSKALERSADFDRKTEINKRVAARYDELMQEGKHGHYETMFKVVHEELARAQPDDGWQPIETLKCDSIDQFVTLYIEGDVGGFIRTGYRDEHGGVIILGLGITDQATHWRPLPQPPTLNAPVEANTAEGIYRERLQAIIDWADFALSNPADFNKSGVKNLDGPVFDAARAALQQIAAMDGGA